MRGRRIHGGPRLALELQTASCDPHRQTRFAASAQGNREHATRTSMCPALARRSNPASSGAAAAPPAVSLPVSDNSGDERTDALVTAQLDE